MRAIWKGVISFGLVNIPVRLYSAVNPEKYEFHYLHEKDFSRIGYSKMCKLEHREVPSEEIVKGYETPDGRYIVMTDEDFEKANVEKTNRIEVLHFSQEREVECPYYDRPYYLEPHEDSQEAFALLREALKERQAVGVVRYVLRTREHIGILKIWNGTLIVNQVRFTNELRSPEGLLIPEESKQEAGKQMAVDLVKKLTKPFKLSEHKDVYKEELKEIIQAKAAGKVPSPKGEVPQATSTVDLMAALKQSLEKSHASR